MCRLRFIGVQVNSFRELAQGRMLGFWGWGGAGVGAEPWEWGKGGGLKPMN